MAGKHSPERKPRPEWLEQMLGFISSATGGAVADIIKDFLKELAKKIWPDWFS